MPETVAAASVMKSKITLAERKKKPASFMFASFS